MTTAAKILDFYRQLHIAAPLPRGIETMNPYSNADTFGLCKLFYRKYYDDNQPRVLLLGINPGRFGSGTTGISFTDPIRLEKICGIENNFNKKPELSSDFIYRMISAFGGPGIFYRHYFISAVSPLGFTKNGRNINYYDDVRLERAVLPFIVDSIKKLVTIGLMSNVCYCIGEGKNYEFLQKQNELHHWFENIVPLAHPRFIMQYKRKEMEKYIGIYMKNLVPG